MNKYLLEILKEPIKLDNIQEWLYKYENEYFKLVETSNCRKWSKWVKYNERPFPCVCTTREKDCIFIEAYFKLLEVIEVTKKEELYNKALLQYQKVKHNINAVFEWIKDNENIGKELLLVEPIIKVATTNEPYTTVDIYLDTKENSKLWEFKEIFEFNYYSEEYENY